MHLASKLAFLVDRRVQFKGRDLYDSGAVRITTGNADYVEAVVRGTRLYDVRLRYEDNNLNVSCECPYFADFEECKHIWATILEADKKGVLADARHAGRLSLEGDGVEDRVVVPAPRLVAPVPPPRVPAWNEHLRDIHARLQPRGNAKDELRESEILYVLDVGASRVSAAVVVDLFSRTKKRNGEWTVYKELRIAPGKTGSLPNPVDAEIVAAMLGGTEAYNYSYTSTYGATRKALPHVLALKLVPMMAGTGRLSCRMDAYQKNLTPVTWDEGPPWKLWLEMRQDERDQWTIAGSLRRGEERMPLEEPALILGDGFLLARDRLARLDDDGAFPWITQLRSLKHIHFPDREREAVLAMVLNSPVVPPLDLDAPLRFEERHATARPGLRVTQARTAWGEDAFQAHLLFDYGSGWTVDLGPTRGIWSPAERVYLVRDAATEDEARALLREFGLKPPTDGKGGWRLTAKQMPRVVRELLRAGWHVEADGKAFRTPGATRVDVRSGIDWFELHGEVDYGGATVGLPELLGALRRGDTMVPLGDGSFGVLPEAWLERFAPLAGLGAKHDDHLRFQRNQAGLLDALLAAQPDVKVDEVFERVRQKLGTFQGVRAPEQPAGFKGQLRDYQREGVGWMEFLREFGFGGCLADDMGVGKTAQVLATLEARRAEGKGPSLVVAPKSVMFNWRQEAERFTPQLRVLEYTGLARDIAQVAQHDLVLTTYGTMLRDAPRLVEITFDYLVLDEAQAVKNASTASAKAVRLLRGGHRLALSGTPVENHLGELWSLFEFLNPGMLGEAKVLKMAGGLARNPGEDARRLLSHALRPFILRRTKQQVARELPEKTEQTIFCELEAAQRKQYDELLAHYRASLLTRVDKQGMGRSRMHVLEALLRLRQAACHPGLLDPSRAGESSAKLDVLLDHLDEIREEGHKALVFSQFTSLLAIVRRHLDEAGVRYEYLDGQTRDRQTHVETFQNDPDCPLFLISLKAGGLGLNLTAAEYVFLLDPWWNPAVEAQAVDRAHRIGQTRPVFAYRLIAKGTVEEKVLELQKTKRDLADAILGEDNSLIRDLKREDLELLLS